MQKMRVILASCALLLIVSGCGATESPDIIQTKPATIEKKQTTKEQKEQTTTDIILTAKIAGDNTVSFEWNPTDDIAQKAEGWRILYGKEPNPTSPSTWWFERSKPYRDKVWSGLPGGNAHFRICSLIDDTCDVYSNDVEVDIPEQINISEEQKNCMEKEDTFWDTESETCSHNKTAEE